jgi:hypothetical protein
MTRDELQAAGHEPIGQPRFGLFKRHSGRMRLGEADSAARQGSDTHYRLVKEGRGPRLTKIASRTLVSAEAAAEWRARMERETEQTAPQSKPTRSGRAATMPGREAA